MRKTCGQVCAEIIKKYNKNEWDMGMYAIGNEMYCKIQKSGITKTKINHPIDRLTYVSLLLLHDTKSKKGYWIRDGKAYYRGIFKNPVAVYKLRERSVK